VFVLGVFCVFFVLPDFDAIARSETPELRKSVCSCWRWEFVFLLLFGVFFVFVFVFFQLFGRAGVFLIASGGDLILKEILLDRREEFLCN
jgi:type II secretory pathway component PulF